MARVTGLEPATSGVTGRRSNQLSYTRIPEGRVFSRVTGGAQDPIFISSQFFLRGLMGEIVNLNKARKAKRKAEQTEKAEANRIFHGLTRAERDKTRQSAEREGRRLDSKKLEDGLNPDRPKPDQDQ